MKVEYTCIYKEVETTKQNKQKHYHQQQQEQQHVTEKKTITTKLYWRKSDTARDITQRP